MTTKGVKGVRLKGERTLFWERNGFRFIGLLLTVAVMSGIACSKPATPDEKIAAVKRIVRENLPRITQRM